MKHHTRSYLRALAALTLTAPFVYTAHAASGTWTSASSGLWSDTANWLGGTVADASGSTADFNTLDLTADTTVNLDSARTLTGLTFGDNATATEAGWTLANNGNAANILTLAGTTPTITVNALGTGKTATISAVIAGTAGLTKAGAGTLTLTGTNTYTGNTNVTAGTVAVTGAGRIFSTASNLNVGTVTAGTVNYSSTATSALNNVVLGGGSNSGTVNQTAGRINVGTDVRLNTALGKAGTYNLSGGGILAVGGKVNVGERSSTSNFNLSGDASLTAASLNLAIFTASSNSATVGTVTQSGTSTATVGTVTLTGASNDATTHTATYNLNGGTLTTGSITAGAYTGTGGSNTSTFNFAGGTLKASATTATFMQGLTTANVKNGGAIIDTNGFNVTIGQGLVKFAGSTTDTLTKLGTGTLTLSGTNTYTGKTTVTAGNLTLASTGSLASSTIEVATGAIFDAGTAVMTKTFNLAEGAVVSGLFTATGTTTVTANLADGFSQIASGLTFTKAGSLNLLLSNVGGGEYSLFTGGFAGAFASVSISGTALTDDGGGVFSGKIGEFNFSYNDNVGINTLTISAVPEPATYAFLAGLGILGFVVYRRRTS